jgi:hypothetical protein
MEENTETKAAPEAPTTKKRGKRTKAYSQEANGCRETEAS